MGIYKNNKTSFTLLEMMMVMVIIGILASMGGLYYLGVVERSRWVGPLYVASDVAKSCSAYHNEHGRYPDSFSQIDIGDPNPSGSPKPNQFRYLLGSGCGVVGALCSLVYVYKDKNGDGSIGIVDEPYIQVFSDGSFSSRNGAPKF